MRRLAQKTRLSLFSMPLLVMLATACTDLDTTRNVPVRGTTGEELFGVVCDRVSAQALREDLSGASFHAICHKDANGQYADQVDESQLPPPTDGLTDTNGNPVSVDQQAKNRAYALARIGALVRDRAALIEAFDFIFPNVNLPVKDIHNADPAHSCDPAQGDAALRTLGKELSDLLGRLTPLYDDGTIPSSTEALARMSTAFQTSPDAQTALAHLSKRNGYRPLEIAIGMARPMLAYSQFRDFSAQSLRIFSSDADPFNPNPQYDSNGHRIQIPGSAYAQLSALMAASHEELRTSTADPVLPVLGVAKDATLGRDVLSRPRSNLEVMRELFYATDPTYDSSAKNPAYIVRRDARGFAMVALANGAIPAPFVDKNGDGLADVDDLGNFVTSNGQPAPSPFFSLDAPDSAPRDPFARALSGQNLLYQYLDTSHLYSAQLLTDLKPLVDAAPVDNHETLMNALAGAWILYGDRSGPQGSKKSYPPDPNAVATWNLSHPNGPVAPAGLGTDPVVLEYNGFKTDTSPLLDLVYALGNVLGDQTSDDTLQYTRALVTGQTATVARLTGAGLAWKATADAHPEAKNAHNPTSVFWDEMLAVVQQIAMVPGLLEDVLRALGDDSVLGTSNNVPLGTLYSNYMKYGDHISYDRQNLNGPAFNVTTNKIEEMKTPVDRSKPDVGFQRSAFARFLQAIYDTDGVTACNKDGAVAHAQDLPLFGSGDIYSDSPYIGSLGASTPFKECEVFKIPNLAKFYLDATIGRAQITFRPDIFREGLNLGVTHIGAAQVKTIEDSTGIGNGSNCGAGPCIPGSWDTNTGDKLWRDATHYGYFPTPEFLNRLVYFDVAKDSPNSGDKNYTTNHFLTDMQGPYIGTAVCPERVIPDPCVGNGNCPSSTDFGYDVDADGMIHGLRSCKDGDWLQQRDPDATLVWEDFGFYNAMAPVVTAFANHNSEELLIQILDILYKHWQDGQGTAQDCNPSDPKDPRYCTQDGLSSYEPLLSEAFVGDMLPAMHDLEKILETVQIPHCTAVDPTTKQCTASTQQDGITTFAETTRSLFDEDRARTVDLRDRLGNSFGLRNDGTHTAQVTPIYLLTNALDHIDAQFDAYAKANPTDTERLVKWRSARSQLVDQFLKVAGTGTGSSFANKSFPSFTPTLVDVIRAQLYANCPNSFTPPYPRCEWARTQLTQKMATTMSGPTFAGMMDVFEAIRADDGARIAMENLLTYLIDAASQNDAQASVMATTADMIQLLDDDTNLVPLYHVLAEGAAQSIRDDKGNVVQASAVDSTLALLSQIAAYARDSNGTEVCAREIDPNQVLNIALKNMVTPLPSDPSTPNAPPRKTPIEVILDVITDVNRVSPDQTDKLQPPDYANISSNVSDFLINKESGLEQFYAIVRNGTE